MVINKLDEKLYKLLATIQAFVMKNSVNWIRWT